MNNILTKNMLKMFAIIACYLIVTIPVAYATNVNIIFGGTIKDTAQVSPANLVNKQITVKANPPLYTDVKIDVKIDGASLAYSVKKIFLYTCKKSPPNDCIRTSPLQNTTYMHAELNWNDISERLTTSAYPRIANLLALVELEDANQNTIWVGFWDTVERLDTSVFNVKSAELTDIDLYAKSADLVNPIKNFANNRQSIPFTWLDKVVFKTATKLYGAGGTKTELESLNIQSSVDSKNEVISILKEYQLIFPETAGGVANPVTLNLNPSFTCGNGIKETELGEGPLNCCYDAGCGLNEYCDVSDNSTAGICRQEAISLEVIPGSLSEITDCSSKFTLKFTARVKSPPVSLASTANGFVKLDDILYPVTCDRSPIPNDYSCSVQLDPEVKCGTGNYRISPNSMNLTIVFNNGPSEKTKELSRDFSDITVNYNCGCPQGQYCDIGVNLCRQDVASLTIPEVSSYLTNYAGGTAFITVSVKINNPPSGLSVSGITYQLGNITFDSGSHPGATGVPTCTGGQETDYVYSCSIPFSIPGYDKARQYIIKGNSITFDISYPSGANTITRKVSTTFSDITIPSRNCGDGVKNPEETAATCCVDVGCSANEYCDVEKSCRLESSVALAVESIEPKSFTDCTVPHTLNITAKINNMPTGLNIDRYVFKSGGQIKPWSLFCTQPNPVTGIVTCQLTITQQPECKSTPYSITNNELVLTVSFKNGLPSSPFYTAITKDITTKLDDIVISPTYKCGNGIKETDVGESASNCCVDIPCKDDLKFGSNYYCDSDPLANPNGVCISKSQLRLVIDSPKKTVSFDNCEIDNKVEIKAHIESQPSQFRVQNINAILNGENARVRCQQDPAITGNFSFECELLVPKVFECQRGQTYSYTGNSLAFLVSFKNGQTFVTQPLSAKLPDVTISQGFTSLFDIIQDTNEKLNKVLDRLEGIVKRAQSYAKLCVTLSIIGAIATFALILTGILKPEIFGDSVRSGEAARAGAEIGAALQLGIKSVCASLSTLTTVNLKLADMQIQKIQIDQCIATHQHTIDSGSCRGQELSCYNQLKSCYSNVNSIIATGESIRNDINRLGNELVSVNDQIIQKVQNLDYLGGFANFYVSCDGGTDQSSKFCCEYSGVKKEMSRDAATGTVFPRECKLTRLVANARDIKNCNSPMIVVDGDIAVRGSRYDIADVKTLRWEYKDHTFELYCDKNNNGKADEKEKLSGTELTIEYVQDDGTCYCQGTTGSLAISNVKAEEITSTSATITWETNMESDSQVSYGINRLGEIFSPKDSHLTKVHIVKLTSLKPATTYKYIVISEVPTTGSPYKGTSSPEFTFTTQTKEPENECEADHPGNYGKESNKYYCRNEAECDTPTIERFKCPGPANIVCCKGKG